MNRLIKFQATVVTSRLHYIRYPPCLRCVVVARKIVVAVTSLWQSGLIPQITRHSAATVAVFLCALIQFVVMAGCLGESQDSLVRVARVSILFSPPPTLDTVGVGFNQSLLHGVRYV